MADPDDIEEARTHLQQRFKALSEINQEQGSDGGVSESEQLYDVSTVLETPKDVELMTEERLSEALTDLARLIQNKTNEESNAALSYLTILADASRDVPILRSFYGLRVRPSDDENAVHLQLAETPDCVLELARRTLNVQHTGPFSGIRRQALRITANCCAYNNQNRSLIIGRHGIRLIRQFAFDQEDLDVVVPTLFNVCSDFDEGARDSFGKLIQTSDKMEAGWPATLSKAERALGSFDESSQKTATERLLALTPRIEPDQLPLLADVIEIASHPAIYGLGHILDMADPDSVQSSLKTLFAVLAEQSPEFALDEDARAAICQTYLNISGQPAAQNFLIQSPKDFAAFTRFPYLESEREDMYTKAFLKITYAITSLPAYSETATPDSTIIGDAVKQITDEDADLFALAPYLVLVANSLTNPDRIKEFHELHSLTSHINDIITNTRNANVLLPALSICNRLTLIADAQNALFAAGILDSLAEVLFSTSSSTSAKLRIPERNKDAQRDQKLQVHRECLALIRLVVKGSSERALSLLPASISTPPSSSTSASTPNPTAAPHPPSRSIQLSLLSQILNLAQSTIDAQSKLEIGRLLVEILRCISSTTPIKPPQTQESQGRPDLTVLTTIETIDAVVFLLTDGPAEVVWGEGLFGLGLVASLPTTSMTSVISAGGGASASTVAPTHGDSEADTAAEEGSDVGADRTGNQGGNKAGDRAVSNIMKSLSRHKDKVLPVLKKIVGSGSNRDGDEGGDPSSTSISTSTSANIKDGIKAEVENLKYLMAHLLRVVGDRDNQESSTGAEVEVDLDMDTEMDFIQELRGLGREMGLSSRT